MIGMLSLDVTYILVTLDTPGTYKPRGLVHRGKVLERLELTHTILR